MSVIRPITKPIAPGQRSAVTNGKKSFVDGNHNAAWARRWRDIVYLHMADLGGVKILTQAQISLIRRVATISIELELMEGKLSKGEAVDLDLYSRMAGHLRRYLETLGIERRSRDITPNINDYIKARASA